MIEVNASIKSSQLNVTQYQASSERNALAVQMNGKKATSSGLNNQEKQIVDQVGISAEALQKFEDAKLLVDQLQGYLDYLNGRTGKNSVTLTANDNQPSVQIAGQSTQLAASVTTATYQEDTLDINAKFDDAGNLQELSINKTSVTAEYKKVDLLLQDTQFYASAA